MNTKDFIESLLNGEESKHFNELLKEYGVSIGREGKNWHLWHRYGSSFNLGGKNFICLLEWVFRNIEEEAENRAKRDCEEKFKENLMKLLK